MAKSPSPSSVNFDPTGQEKTPCYAPVVQRDCIDTGAVADQPREYFGYTKPRYFDKVRGCGDGGDE